MPKLSSCFSFSCIKYKARSLWGQSLDYCNLNKLNKSVSRPLSDSDKLNLKQQIQYAYRHASILTIHVKPRIISHRSIMNHCFSYQNELIWPSIAAITGTVTPSSSESMYTSRTSNNSRLKINQTFFLFSSLDFKN